MPKRLGFTLIEILIVVSIIALLSVIGLVIYTQFVRSARDSRRQADLRIIQSALEDYHADWHFYPGSLDFSALFALTNATGVPAPLPPVTKTYLNEVPIGPIGTSEYIYRAFKRDNSDCTSADNSPGASNPCAKYCLYAQTENVTQKTALCPDQSGFNLEVTSP